MKWSGEQYKCRKCGEVYPYRLSMCSCGGVCDKIADASQGSSSGLNFDCSVLADVLDDEKQKEQERKQKEWEIEQERKQKERERCVIELAQLNSAVKDACSKNDYAAAISYLERILKIVPDSVEAKNLLDFCKNKVEEHRQEEAKKHDLSIPGTNAGERKTVTVNGVEFAFRWCPAGTFMMGASLEEIGRYEDEMLHQVTLTKGFWMMETQVTQKQWQAVMGTNPSSHKGDDLPVEQVYWQDCQKFCKECAQLGLLVQLPTEAQWEYACRAGTTGAYAGNLDDMAWYTSNSGSKTHPVGTKKPNAWGLYDMHGNVWEWCQDWKADYPYGRVIDPAGPEKGYGRVYRGGSWSGNAWNCRSAYRNSSGAACPGNNLGFRVLGGQ